MKTKNNKKKTIILIFSVIVVLALALFAFLFINNKNDDLIEDTDTIESAAKKVAVTNIKLSRTTAKMTIDNSIKLTATVSPSNATDKKVTWTSSNTKVATVDSTGKVIAKGTGTAKITAKTSNGKTASCSITVEKYVVNLNISKSGDVIGIFTPTIISEYHATIANAPKTIKWTSSDENIAIVEGIKGNPLGKNSKMDQMEGVTYDYAVVVGRNPGKVTITATSDQGVKVSTTLTVTPDGKEEIEEVKMNETSISLLVTQTRHLNINTKYSTNSNRTITWKSNNPGIASVDANGNVKAVSPGTATITVTVKGNTKTVSATCKVVVKKGTIVPSKTPITCKAGEKVVITMSGTSKVKDYLSQNNNLVGITKQDDTHFTVICKKTGKTEVHFASPELGYLILPVTVK